MKNIEIKKLEKVEAPKGEYKNIIAFQLVEFSINFFGNIVFVYEIKIRIRSNYKSVWNIYF